MRNPEFAAWLKSLRLVTDEASNPVGFSFDGYRVEFIRDDAGRPVEAYYLVTRADCRTLNDAEYTDLSLAAWVMSMQADVAAGRVIGYLNHPEGLYDDWGWPVDFRDDTNEPLFVVRTLEWDESLKEVRAWVRYLDTPLGILLSDKIRRGERPKVSLRVIASCTWYEVCDVVPGIGGFDQVTNPAMPGAQLLEYREITDSAKPRNAAGCACHAKTDRSTTMKKRVKRDQLMPKLKGMTDAAAMKAYLDGALAKRHIGDMDGSAILEKIQGMADVETIKTYLEGLFDGMAGEETDETADPPAPASEDPSSKSDGEKPFMDAQAARRVAATEATKAVAAILPGMVERAVKPLLDAEAARKEQEAASRKAAETRKSIEDSVKEWLSAEKFGDHVLKNFSEAEIRVGRDRALKADSVEVAKTVLETHLDALASTRAGKHLGSLGFERGTGRPQGRTVEVQRDAQPWMPYATKLQEAFDAYSLRKDAARHRAKTETRKANKAKVDAMLGKLPDTHVRALCDAAEHLDAVENKFGSMVTGDEVRRFIRDSTTVTPDVPNAVLVSDVVQRLVLGDLTALQFMGGEGPGSSVFDLLDSKDARFGRVVTLESEVPEYGFGDDEFLMNSDGTFRKVKIKTSRRQYFTRKRGAYYEMSRTEMWNLLWGPLRFDDWAAKAYRSEEALMYGIERGSWIEMFRAAQEYGSKARGPENVADVAPSGSGPLYTGEYKKATSGVVTIGGQTYGTSGGNIVAALRVRGGNTSNTGFRNVPVVQPRATLKIDIDGNETYDIVNEIVIKVGASTLIQGKFDGERKNILLMDGSAPTTEKVWAGDLENGIFCLNDNSGADTDPTSPQVQVTKYTEDTNWDLFVTTPESGVEPRKHYTRFFELTNSMANRLAGTENVAPGLVVLPSIRATIVETADISDTQRSPKGAVLASVYSPDNYIFAYGSLGFFKTNSEFPLGSARGLMFHEGMSTLALGQPLEVSEPTKYGTTKDGSIIPNEKLFVDMLQQDLIATGGVYGSDGKRRNFPVRTIRFVTA